MSLDVNNKYGVGPPLFGRQSDRCSYTQRPDCNVPEELQTNSYQYHVHFIPYLNTLASQLCELQDSPEQVATDS